MDIPVKCVSFYSAEVFQDLKADNGQIIPSGRKVGNLVTLEFASQNPEVNLLVRGMDLPDHVAGQDYMLTIA